MSSRTDDLLHLESSWTQVVSSYLIWGQGLPRLNFGWLVHVREFLATQQKNPELKYFGLMVHKPAKIANLSENRYDTNKP